VEGSLGLSKPLFGGNFAGLSFPNEVFKTQSATESKLVKEMYNPLDEVEKEAQSLKSLFSQLSKEAQDSIEKIEGAMKKAEQQR
jgi:hypothetical protein